MNPEYVRIIAAPEEDRRGLFAATARRIGTTEQNVEKDFWVCWTLDALFHRLPAGGPRLLFKGGTSLSKAFGLISRFSEDIDITVFRSDLGDPVSIQELKGLSGKKRRARLDAIKDACQRYIHDDLRGQLDAVVAGTFRAAGGRPDGGSVVADDADPDGQTLLIHYPSVVPAPDVYVQPSVRIEAGAKSALDPHVAATVEPYIARDIAARDLRVEGITTIEPARTFWDKVVILHGLRRWFENRGELRQEGQRVSRHYYDIHCLLRADTGAPMVANLALGTECVRHARMFFDRPDFDLATAAPGTFALAPTPAMLERLEPDYQSMAGMIFGPIPEFNDVVASVVELERRLNRSAPNVTAEK
jgi:hypothetical protein